MSVREELTLSRMKRAQDVTMKVLAVAVFLSTVQALFWALIPKPGQNMGGGRSNGPLRWAAYLERLCLRLRSSPR